STLKPQLTAYPALASRLNTGLCAFEAIHPLADSATWPLARLVGRPALSLLASHPAPAAKYPGSFLTSPNLWPCPGNGVGVSPST
ncbi:MAG: hypothetical protein Q8N89_14965, partial [Azonexus sp.]|nr:hypothetical protein [Azonexus sp.]